MVASTTELLLREKTEISSGMGQCMAEMVAAQQFNQAAGQQIQAIFGCVSTGLLLGVEDRFPMPRPQNPRS
jgi:hypothetical protein